MEQVTDFIRDNTALILGIMGIATVALVIDRDMTYLCPADQRVMKRIKRGEYLCQRCGFVKRLN